MTPLSNKLYYNFYVMLQKPKVNWTNFGHELMTSNASFFVEFIFGNFTFMFHKEAREWLEKLYSR
jgi:hypothetical protein